MRPFRLILAVAVVLAPVAARADGPATPAAPATIEVQVGRSAERDVGIARGMRCDDTSIITVDMRTRAQTSNVFVVTGVKEGTTLCRVGLDPQQYSIVFRIHVVPAVP